MSPEPSTDPAAGLPADGIVVMKFGGTSVADAERLIDAAKRMVRARAEGQPGGRRALRPRRDDRPARRDGSRDLARAAPSRDGHAALDRRAHLVRAVRDGAQRPRYAGDLAVGLAGRDRDRRLAHQGAHPRRAGRPHPGRPRGRQRRAGGGLPGRLDLLARRHDARARRLRHDGGGARGGARRRSVRDLHGRRRRLLRGPADRPGRAQAAGAVLRGDARDVGLRREGPPVALGRVRAQLRRADPRAAELRRRLRYPRAQRGGNDGTPPDHSRHAFHRGRSRDAHRRPRPPRHRGAHLRRARRRGRERRHDRPERAGVGRPPGRDLLHCAAHRPATSRSARSRGWSATSASTA